MLKAHSLAISMANMSRASLSYLENDSARVPELHSEEYWYYSVCVCEMRNERSLFFWPV